MLYMIMKTDQMSMLIAM